MATHHCLICAICSKACPLCGTCECKESPLKTYGEESNKYIDEFINMKIWTTHTALMKNFLDIKFAIVQGTNDIHASLASAIKPLRFYCDEVYMQVEQELIHVHHEIAIDLRKRYK